MKKIGLLILFIPRFALAAPPITAQDFPKVIQTVNQVLTDAHAMLDYAIKTQQLANNGYVFTIPGSNETVQMTPQQQQDMFNSYTQLKAAIQTDLNSMP